MLYCSSSTRELQVGVGLVLRRNHRFGRSSAICRVVSQAGIRLIPAKTGGIMHFSEYIEYDAVGLAHLIRSGQVSAQEVQQLARQAILAVNPTLNALVGELFSESPPSSNRRASSGRRPAESGAETTGSLAGVPFVVKDLSLH